jgi:type I restriction enzyme M protein
MTDTNQKKLGSTLWGIADQLRGAMNADDFRDYMLSFLFLRYLSDNYEDGGEKELGSDYPKLLADDQTAFPLSFGTQNNRMTSQLLRSRCAAKCITSLSRNTCGAASPSMARTQT